MEKTPQKRALPIFLRILHWFIIANFLLQIFYGAYMVFFVMKPTGITGPLWENAIKIPPEQMLIRRLYALETWIAISGLSIYLALTEFLPRILQIKKMR